MTVQCCVSEITTRKRRKGDISCILDIPGGEEGARHSSWGRMQNTLANGGAGYVIVEITGTSKSQVDAYCGKAPTIIDYAHTTSGGLHHVTATLHPRIVDNFSGGLKQDMRDFLESEHGASFTSWNAETGVAEFTIPDTTDIPLMKRRVFDLVHEDFGGRYKFPNADVDTVAAAGGFTSITKQVAQNRIIDRLA